MKVWITKYALTQNIFECDVEHNEDYPNMVTERDSVRVGSTQHYHGKDWHHSKENAIRRANEMRDKKISSLKKTIGKLQHKNFT